MIFKNQMGHLYHMDMEIMSNLKVFLTISMTLVSSAHLFIYFVEFPYHVLSRVSSFHYQSTRVVLLVSQS